ncbi:sigma 54-interacting transcriptional regulator [Dehalobacter sp. DCM]|uniref:sigma-54 interaction domain-containing protein n=1 Tax=Dehalobacter sp. DCM TaxID=2907827 RepID=UPI0030820FBF|nr:sigma 54-interacting transcriptional regulator [Dehalobacter sp. DCM]
MPNSLIEIDPEVKKEITALSLSMGLSDSETVKMLMEKNNQLSRDIKQITKELSLLKERELEAFVIGDVLSDGIYIIDSKGIIIAVNKAFTKMTGIEENEIIGHPVEELINRSIVQKPIGRVVLEKKEKLSATIVMKDKKIVITGNPIFDNNGDVTQVLIVMRDVTELVKLQDQLEHTEKMTQKYRDELQYFRSKEIHKSELIGNSTRMHQLKELITQVAQVDATVLITGETGVGKEVVAREIHKMSPRKKAPYIKVNCAAIPESLLESELFGYEKGAFTGAQNKEKLGLFEIANSGTILLDEIGEMPISLQSKLLRALQEKEIRRLGGTKSIKLDVRVIAATNQKLEHQVAEGKFRQDLYYRLNVVPIHIPPLRMRKEDIPLLINCFLEKFNEKYKQNKSFEIAAIELMQQYNWPGNVRELENIIEQLVVIIKEPVIKPHNILNITDNSNIISDFFDKKDLTLKQAVDMVEKQIIEKALKTYGSTHKAAVVLGVSQPTVLRKARELGIKTSN